MFLDDSQVTEECVWTRSLLHLRKKIANSGGRLADGQGRLLGLARS